MLQCEFTVCILNAQRPERPEIFDISSLTKKHKAELKKLKMGIVQDCCVWTSIHMRENQTAHV